VLNKILGAPSSDLSHVTNVPALRIHSVDLLKAILAAGDETAVAQLQALLDLHPAWKEFKHQSHDLFLTDKEKTDIYLIQDASDTKFAGLLTDGSVQEGINEMFAGKLSYSTQGALSNEKVAFSPFHPNPTAAAASAPAPAPAPAVSRSTGGAGAGTPMPPPMRSSVGAMPYRGATSAPIPTPLPAAASVPVPRVAPPPVPAAPAPALAQADQSTPKTQVVTRVEKGELGIGLDLGKAKTGQAQVLRLKEFPPEVVNPASLCNPAIRVGDVIVGVNGEPCSSLAEAVKVIRAAVGVLQLTLERNL